jgi:hypothetical protein
MGWITTEYFDIEAFEIGLYLEMVEIAEVKMPAYMKSVQPLDTSENADDVIMQETNRDASYVHTSMGITSLGIGDEDNGQVPYWTKRNYENDLHPEKKGYIEKGNSRLRTFVEAVDYEKLLD